MRRSESSAPKPPIIDAKKMFSGWAVRKNPTANGVENPKEKNKPAMKIPK